MKDILTLFSLNIFFLIQNVFAFFNKFTFILKRNKIKIGEKKFFNISKYIIRMGILNKY
jgi:hypothetical protein